MRTLELLTQRDHSGYLRGGTELGDGEHEAVGHSPGSVQDQLQGADSAPTLMCGKPFGANSQPRRTCRIFGQGGQRCPDRPRMGVLDGIGSPPVAVLEVESEVLDGRTAESVAHEG